MENIANVKVYDEGDVVMDRYTVVIGDDVFGMSFNALSPIGFNQYCCPSSQLDENCAGKEVAIKDLPEDVQTAIKRRME